VACAIRHTWRTVNGLSGLPCRLNAGVVCCDEGEATRRRAIDRRAIGILWYEQPEDLDGITQLVGTWFQDHIAPRLAGPETVVRGRVVVSTTPPHTAAT
jgi:hypothetical protein